MESLESERARLFYLKKTKTQTVINKLVISRHSLVKNVLFSIISVINERTKGKHGH